MNLDEFLECFSCETKVKIVCEDEVIFSGRINKNIRVTSCYYYVIPGKTKIADEVLNIVVENKYPQKIRQGDDEYRKVRYVIDHAWQWRFFDYYIKLKGGMYICDGEYDTDPFSRDNKEAIDVCFKAKSSSELMLMNDKWGNFNECPSAEKIAAYIKDWEESYGAELIEITHDALTFKCNKTLNEGEADKLLKQIGALRSNSLDIAAYDVIMSRLMKEGIFILWWD